MTVIGRTTDIVAGCRSCSVTEALGNECCAFQIMETVYQSDTTFYLYLMKRLPGDYIIKASVKASYIWINCMVIIFDSN